MVTVSLYARVSSGKQAQEDTIASQIAAIENQISMDGHKLLNEYKFIDNGYSGSNIIRPGLEKLRDKIAEGIALFTIIRTDRNMLLACYSHKHISYRIRTIIRKAITLIRFIFILLIVYLVSVHIR